MTETTLAGVLAAECDDPVLLADLLAAAVTPLTDGLGPLVPPRPLPTVLPPWPWPAGYRAALMGRLRAHVAYMEARARCCDDETQE
jgi:hypothetical protein